MDREIFRTIGSLKSGSAAIRRLAPAARDHCPSGASERLLVAVDDSFGIGRSRVARLLAAGAGSAGAERFAVGRRRDACKKPALGDCNGGYEQGASHQAKKKSRRPNPGHVYAPFDWKECARAGASVSHHRRPRLQRKRPSRRPLTARCTGAKGSASRPRALSAPSPLLKSRGTAQIRPQPCPADRRSSLA